MTRGTQKSEISSSHNRQQYFKTLYNPSPVGKKYHKFSGKIKAICFVLNMILPIVWSTVFMLGKKLSKNYKTSSLKWTTEFDIVIVFTNSKLQASEIN